MRALALAYHDISVSWQHDLAVTPETFAHQLARLAERGYTGVTLSELAAGSLDRRVVAITFDDGFRSVLTQAKPALDSLGWPGTVFAVTDGVGSPGGASWIGPSAAAQPLLAWHDLEALASAGWEIGSHGRTHRLLSKLEPAELADELEGSRRAVADRVGSCRSISYPWGEVDRRVVAAARGAGYTAGSGLAGRATPGDPLAVTRFAVGSADGALRFALKTSPAVQSLRRTAAWTAVTTVRRPHRPLGVPTTEL